MSIRIDNTGAITLWVPSTVYSLNDVVNAASSSLSITKTYECTTAGVSGAVEPAASNPATWSSTTAYSINDEVRATLDNQPVIFRCTVAGTSGVTEPTWDPVLGNTTVDATASWIAVSWWRQVDGDLVSDGSAIWTARAPLTWQYAMLTIYRGLVAWYADLDNTVALHMEKFHLEATTGATTLTISTPGGYDYVAAPNLFRVDKLSDIYSPTVIDGTIHPNIQTQSGDMLMNANCTFHGLRMTSGNDLSCRYSSFEDCTVIYGTDVVQHRKLYFPNSNNHVDFTNCLIQSDALEGATIQLTQDGKVTFNACKFIVDSAPTGFISGLANNFDFQDMTFNDCDLGAMTNPKLIDESSFATGNPTLAHNNIAKVRFNDCLLPDNYVVWDSLALATTATFAKLSNCSANGRELVINHMKDQSGERLTEFDITLPGGYVSEIAQLPISERLIPSMDCTPGINRASSKIGVFVPSAGAKVFTLELLENFTNPLTSKDLWIDLYYFESAGPRYTVDTSTKEYAQLTYTQIPVGIGLSAWLGPTTGYRSAKLTVPVTVSRPGVAYCILRLGKYELGKDVVTDLLLRVA